MWLTLAKSVRLLFAIKLRNGPRKPPEGTQGAHSIIVCDIWSPDLGGHEGNPLRNHEIIGTNS